MFQDFKPSVKSHYPLPSGFHLRPVMLEDVHSLVALQCEREKGSPRRFIKSWFKEIPQLDSAKRIISVACCDDGLIGYGRLAHYSRHTLRRFNRLPEGWYLMGVIVGRAFRRRGIGNLLTSERIRYATARKASAIHYIANENNKTSIFLHEQLGFKLILEDIKFPRVSFNNGRGCLFRKTIP